MILKMVNGVNRSNDLIINKKTPKLNLVQILAENRWLIVKKKSLCIYFFKRIRFSIYYITITM